MDVKDIFFEKVSFDEFCRAAKDGHPSRDALYEMWSVIPLPRRATADSAGYDFFLPYAVDLLPGYPLVIPTGIRCHMPGGVFLALLPKSGLGFKHGVRLRNGAGVVDADFYSAANEGHILGSLTTEEALSLPAGAKFMQGIFLPYAVTADDRASGARNGGFGSTGV